MKKGLVYVLASALFIAGVLMSIGLGAVVITPRNLIKGIFEYTRGGSGAYSNIIWNIRFPRTLMAVLAGSALSVSGALMQGILKNQLAGPSILGVSSGAGVFAVYTIAFLPGFIKIEPALAFLGGVIAMILVYGLSYKHGIVTSRMIIAGVAVSSFFNSLITIMISYDSERTQGAYNWLIGSISGTVWKDVYLILPYIVIFIAISVIFSKRLNVLVLGDDIAQNLGVNVELWRLFYIAVSVVLCSSIVSVAGIISFIGLIIPNIIRYIGIYDYEDVIPLCVLLGSALVTICDSLGRVIFNPFEIPVGAITALLGAPFFLYVLRRRL